MDEKLNFSQISALVVDGDRFSSGIISQILRGFGLARHSVVGTIEDAKKLQQRVLAIDSSDATRKTLDAAMGQAAP